jgi:hypothetical protein
MSFSQSDSLASSILSSRIVPRAQSYYSWFRWIQSIPSTASYESIVVQYVPFVAFSRTRTFPLTVDVSSSCFLSASLTLPGFSVCSTSIPFLSI